jgi:hypothetical protein
MATPLLERQPRSAVGRADRRPTVGGYWVGGAIAMTGFVVAATWGAFSIVNLYDRVESFPRTAVPGSFVLQLDAGAERVIFYEQPVGTRMQSLADLRVTVTGPDGNVAVDRYLADLRYDLPGASETIGRAVGTFNATIRGSYEVTAVGSAPHGGAITVGESFAVSVIGSVLGAVALLVLTGFTGLAIVVVTAVRRSR